MAIKISELNSSSLPLTGDEIVPLVQGLETKKVTVNDLLSINQITTQIVDSFALLPDLSNPFVDSVSQVVFDIKVDLFSPQGEVEEKGWFYSKTETNPNNINNEGSIDLGGGYSSLPSRSRALRVGVSLVISSNGLVVRCISTDFSELDPETLYYFRPYIKFVDNDPSEYIFGNVVQLTTRSDVAA